MGPVIQANGRQSLEDDLRSGGLLYCVDRMVTLGNPGMIRCWKKSNLSCLIHPAAQSTLCEQQWDLLVHCVHCSVGFQIKIGRPKFYVGEMITPV